MEGALEETFYESWPVTFVGHSSLATAFMRFAGLSQGAESCVEIAMLATNMKPQGCGKGNTICQIQAAITVNKIGAMRNRDDRSGSHCFHQPMVIKSAPK